MLCASSSSFGHASMTMASSPLSRFVGSSLRYDQRRPSSWKMRNPASASAYPLFLNQLNKDSTTPKTYKEVTKPFRQIFAQEISTQSKDDDISIAKVLLYIAAEDEAFLAFNREMDARSFRHAIFSEIQIRMRMDSMLEGGSPVGADNGKTPRLGVIPRYAEDESEMKWFEVPGFNIIHAINAWDEDDGDTIVLIAPNIMSIEHTLERMELVHALVEKVKIDLVTGIVTRHPISARNLDFAVINPAFVGRQSRYVYAAIGDPMPKISGVVKLDVTKGDRDDCTVARRMYGPGCYGGEPFFVARDPGNPEAEEDEGYVVTYVHDEVAGESKFLVMDAKSPELEIVAAVRLPRRVPYGFHGLFVKESDLNKL
ncbi:hypothetical protein F2Q68_00029475 [Brassica cretica]|uniref:Uncharacterized protein n=1 Tax=Brassica cretica TaxID=69181 RepID=A0A8S9GAS8_BRACR|nr:hypothetical protein F2Q68_00029475 [Brassica cretica]